MAATKEKTPNQELTVCGSNRTSAYTATLSSDEQTIVVEIYPHSSDRSWTSGPIKDIPTDVYTTIRLSARAMFKIFQEYIRGDETRIIFPDTFDKKIEMLTFMWPFMDNYKKACLILTENTEPPATPPSNQNNFPMHLVAYKKGEGIYNVTPFQLEIIPPQKGECILTVQALNITNGYFKYFKWQIQNGPNLILTSKDVSPLSLNNSFKTIISADVGIPISFKIEGSNTHCPAVHLRDIIMELTYINQ